MSGDGYLCSNERLLRIGLGPGADSCKLTVLWPDGSTNQYDQLETNRTWLIVQSDDPFELP